MILKRAREKIFFQENKFTGCMVKEGDGKTFHGIQSTVDYPSILK